MGHAFHELAGLGAKSLHMTKIKDAIIAATKEDRSTRARLDAVAGVEVGAGQKPERRWSLQPAKRVTAPAASAPAVALPPGKKFMAFLSHVCRGYATCKHDPQT